MRSGPAPSSNKAICLFRSALRKVLGENAADWVETLPRYGYRFNTDVVEIEANDRSDNGSRAASPPAFVEAPPEPARKLDTTAPVISQRARWFYRIPTCVAIAAALVFGLALCSGAISGTGGPLPDFASRWWEHTGYRLDVRVPGRRAARVHRSGHGRSKTAMVAVPGIPHGGASRRNRTGPFGVLVLGCPFHRVFRSRKTESARLAEWCGTNSLRYASRPRLRYLESRGCHSVRDDRAARDLPLPSHGGAPVRLEVDEHGVSTSIAERGGGEARAAGARRSTPPVSSECKTSNDQPVARHQCASESGRNGIHETEARGGIAVALITLNCVGIGGGGITPIRAIEHIGQLEA